MAHEDDRLHTVLCGTFRKAPGDLRRVFSQLAAHYKVLSPHTVDFVNPGEPFVRLDNETHATVREIEHAHLEAIRSADFVWLFCPDGYVGSSATLEIGYAHSAGVPVLTDVEPADQTVSSLVEVVPDIPTAAKATQGRPGEGVGHLQRYYRRVAHTRGWSEESPRDTLLLLTEELGEVARAVRKQASLSRDGEYGPGEVDLELADLQLYLVHLATALGVDLAEAVTRKEAINAERFMRRASAA